MSNSQRIIYFRNIMRNGVARTIALSILAFITSSLLICGYLIGWTNHESRQKSYQESHAITEMWKRPISKSVDQPMSSSSENTHSRTPLSNAVGGNGATMFNQTQWISRTKRGGFALLYIPRLKNDVWGTPILQGVSRREIDLGIGHYPHSAMPGQKGTFALVGHRATYGAWFAHIDSLHNGDRVIVRIRNRWYAYALYHHAIVSPKATWVLRTPTRFHKKIYRTTPMITLITCNPRWGSSARWIWWGRLVDMRQASHYPFQL